MAKRNYNWLPKPKKLNRKYGVSWMRDGDAMVISLNRQRNDTTVRGVEFCTCCDCGLTHLHTYNIVRIRLKKKTKWYLVERAYRIQGTGDRNG